MRCQILFLSHGLLPTLIGAHDHSAHGQREFSAKRLNDLSAKWGIDASFPDADHYYAINK
jgi:hypothetical protein